MMDWEQFKRNINMCESATCAWDEGDFSRMLTLLNNVKLDPEAVRLLELELNNSRRT